MKFTRQEISWALYDTANSAFTLIIITTVMPIWFNDVLVGGSGTTATTLWGYLQSGAMLMVSLLAPVLGAMADSGRKKSFLLFFALLGTGASLALGAPGLPVIAAMILYALGKLGFHGGNIFYDALITDVTDEPRADRVSALGFALGYGGSVIPFIGAIAAILLLPGTSGAISDSAARIAFVITGVWWLLWTIPLMLTVRQRHSVPVAGNILVNSFVRVFRTIGAMRRHRRLFLFLLAYFLYIDGVDTIISMASIFGREIGLGAVSLLVLILGIQIIALPCTLIYGRLASRFGARALILAGIGVYTALTIMAFIMASLDDVRARTVLFWIIGFLVATSQGGIQALSRSYFASLIPPERSAEFFGFYNIFGKFAAVMGPLLIAVLGQLTGSTRWGILSLVLLFAAGGILLLRTEKTRAA